MPEHGGGLQLPRRIEEEVLLGFQIRRVPVILRSAAAEILLTVDLRRNYRRIGQIRRINVAHVARVVRVIVLTTRDRGVGVFDGLEARVVAISAFFSAFSAKVSAKLLSIAVPRYGQCSNNKRSQRHGAAKLHFICNWWIGAP